MGLITKLQMQGLSYAKARIVAEKLTAMVPSACDAAECETLYRPENRLADEAVRLGVPYDDAKSVALEVLEAYGRA